MTDIHLLMDCVILSISYQNHQQKVTRHLQRKKVLFQRKTMQYYVASLDIEQLMQHIVATSMQLVTLGVQNVHR